MKIKSTIVIDEIEGKTVILDTENNTFVELNEIGGIILDYIKNNEDCEINNVVELVLRDYDAQRNEVEEDVNDFINGLVKEGILVK